MDEPSPTRAPSANGDVSAGTVKRDWRAAKAWLHRELSHEPTEAAAEFQKILDHPGVVLEDPIGALARLQLARALRMTGDASKSRAAYQDLLALWKDADPDTPVLKEARAEYARLP